MKKALFHFATWKLVVTGIVVVGVAGTFVVSRGSHKALPHLATAGRGDVRLTVSATGTVRPSQSVDLAFDRGGRIMRIPVSVGQAMSAGDALITLDDTDVAAQLEQAQATLALQNAKLAQLYAGARPEDIAISQTQLTNAQASLGDAQNGLVSAIQSAYANADDAVRNKADALFINPRVAPQLAFSGIDVQLKAACESERLALESVLLAWQASLATLTASGDLNAAYRTASANLNQVTTFLNNVAYAVNALVPSQQLSATTLAAWQGNVTAARTEVNTAIASVAVAKTALTAAQAAVLSAQSALALKQAPPTKQDIAAQEAQVTQAKANVSYYETQLLKMRLRAPFDGVVGKIVLRVGDIAVTGVPVVTFMQKSKYQVEAYIAETDVSKIHANDPVTVTLDAYGPGVVFNARVTQIDAAPTVSDGVVTYKTTFAFARDDTRILPGMTANLDILGAVHANVLYVPTRTISVAGDGKTVKVFDATTAAVRTVSVETGLRGSDGRTEITSGLNEGDSIVTE